MTHTYSVTASRARTDRMPLRVRVHPSLLDALLPMPAGPELDGLEQAERRSILAAWREDTAKTRNGRAILLRSLGSAAMAAAFQRADRSGLDIAHLPFSYAGPEGKVRCTLSAGVSAAGVLAVEVRAWEGNAPDVAFGGRDMAAALARNKAKAKTGRGR